MDKFANYLPSTASLRQGTTPSEGTARESAPSGLSLSQIDDLWKQMAAMYPHKWTSAVGGSDQARMIWLAGLAGLIREDIRRGLRECIKISRDRQRTGDEDWPPTLGQFRALCEARRERSHRVFAPALPKPPVREETIDSNLEAMKKILGTACGLGARG